MKTICFLACCILFGGCVTPGSYGNFWIGDCIEQNQGIVGATCWGTLSEVSIEGDFFTLATPRCDGSMSFTHRNVINLPLAELKTFVKSRRCAPAEKEGS